MSSLPKIGASDSFRDPLVLRFDGKPGFLPDAPKFFDAALFSEWRPSIDEGFWRRLRDWALRGDHRSLARILAMEQRTVAQPTATGFENVDLPYPNVILLLPQRSKEASQEALDYADAATSAVTSAMERTWSRYVDPILGSRARAYPAKLDVAASCLAFMGEGVFAPRPNERPVGWVRVRLESGAVRSPSLPDGEPAGLYRGQTQLLFSGDWRVSPAACNDLADYPGAFLVRSTRAADGGPRCGVSFHRLEDVNIAWPLVKPLAPSWGDEGVGDAVYKVSFVHEDAQSVFQIEVCADERPSRLLARKPAGLAFAIVGVVEPQDEAGRPARRWWFDLDRDRDGLLCSSAMAPARRSVVCSGNSIEGWDWSRPGARAARGREFGWQNGKRGDEPIRIVARQRPLGWLRAPRTDEPIGYAPATSGDGFALDWLDFAGAIEFTGASAKRWAEIRADLAAEDVPPSGEDLMPGLSPGPGEPEFWVAAKGASTFTRGPRPPLQPGQKFLVAGLVLQCVE